MGDLLFLAAAGLIFYLAYCYFAKEPIIRTKKNLEKAKLKKREQRNQAKKQFYEDILNEDEAVPFQHLFPEVLDIKDGLIIQEDYWYSKIVTVLPVNYYLRDEDEQEKIDRHFESWLSQLDGTLPRIYIQNRFIDLTEDIERIQKTMTEQEDLNEAAQQYGKYMLEDLKAFQTERPRYEAKYYIIFDYQVNTSSLRIDDGDSIEEKAIEKAKAELSRRISTAQTHLSKAENEVIPLSTSGIIEMSYHLFNRRKARKNRFRDINNYELMSLYSTTDQSVEHIASVKEVIDGVIKEQKTEQPIGDGAIDSAEEKEKEVAATAI